MSCFLQGVKFGIPNSRSHLARVLYLLSFDTSNEPVGRAFDKYLDQIPQWVWLSWIPQLLLSLQRPEAPHCKLVLLKIATVYPQVIFLSHLVYFSGNSNVLNICYKRSVYLLLNLCDNIAQILERRKCL